MTVPPWQTVDLLETAGDTRVMSLATGSAQKEQRLLLQCKVRLEPQYNIAFKGVQLDQDFELIRMDRASANLPPRQYSALVLPTE
jgi:hypothetical protein